eukprot:31327-Pelagococcus_subviridis.AAC.4
MPPSRRIPPSLSTARPSSSDAFKSTSPSTTQSRSPAGSTSRCVTRQMPSSSAFPSSSSSRRSKYSGARASCETSRDACDLQYGSI